MALEQEIKLPFPDVEAARRAVVAAGGRLAVSRRLLEDVFYDTADGRLRGQSQALRLRRDGERTILTWKGPRQPGAVKIREEIETDCADADALTALLGVLGYVSFFRTQKYREEYHTDGAVLTVDETPFGVFVEVEAPPATIDTIARRLDRGPADYELGSYITLWRRWCESRGRPFSDMLFTPPAGRESK